MKTRVSLKYFVADCRIVALLRGFFARVYYVVLYQECRGPRQYNQPDRISGCHFNTTLNQSYVMFISLVFKSYQSGGSMFPIFIYSSVSGL